MEIGERHGAGEDQIKLTYVRLGIIKIALDVRQVLVADCSLF